MKIIVEYVDRLWTRELHVLETDTLDQIRRRLVRVLPEQNISPDEIQLTYEGTTVENGRVNDIGLQEGSVLVVEIKRRREASTGGISSTGVEEIHVDSSEGRFTLTGLEDCDTIQKVKELIAARKGYPVEEQQLHFNGEEVSDARLSGLVLGILGAPVPVLALTLRKPRIGINMTGLRGETHSLEVDASDTVDRLMDRVHEFLGVVPSQQRLVHEGKQLQSGRPLSDYGVCQGSTVHLTGRLRGGCNIPEKINNFAVR